MEHDKKTQTQELLNDMRSELPKHLRTTPEWIQKAGLEITQVHEKKTSGKAQSNWFLYTKLPVWAAEFFEIQHEVLVLVLANPRVFQVDLQSAATEVSKTLRLDRNLILVFTDAETSTVDSGWISDATHRNFVFIGLEKALAQRDPQRWFREFLVGQITGLDLFDSRNPVFGRDFFGRSTEIDRIRKLIGKGQPVGIFGLRKVGKTSLALKVIQTIHADRSNAAVVPVGLAVRVDMLALPKSECHLGGFCRVLLDELVRTRLGFDPTNNELFRPLSELREMGDDSIVRETQKTIQCVLNERRNDGLPPRLTVFVDEYERLLTGTHDSVEEGLNVLDWLRGLSQQFLGRFGFVIIGLTRRHAIQPRFGQRQNPLFSFLVEFRLAGLPSEELAKLIKTIGKRLGLNFQTDAIDAIFQHTGGHPFLSRLLGNVIHQRAGKRSMEKLSITRRHVDEALPTFQGEANPTLEEIWHTVNDIHLSGGDYLRYLAEFPNDSSEVCKALGDDATNLLCDLGILEWSENTLRIRIGAFGRWLMDNLSVNKEPIRAIA